MLFSTICN